MTSLSIDFPIEEAKRRLDFAIQNAMGWMRSSIQIQNNIRSNSTKTDQEEKDKMSKSDIEMGALLERAILSAFPDDGILCEDKEEQRGESSFRWVLDPIDGSMNFVRGIPLFAISIGIEHRETPVAGVVLLPVLEDVYSAFYGEGARKNSQKISVSETKELSRAMFTPNLPSKRQNQIQEILTDLTAFLTYARSFRRSGSFVLDLCWVAEGLLDGVWEKNTKPWDVCAGGLILREAGGKITDLEGRHYLMGTPEIIASNSELHSELLMLLQNVRNNFSRN